ncbi:type I DNA topoisomerase [Polymorphobacter fuscus]|uniref:DNA topoisomerase 1 n=1 Tax=Sandarakinorhabdus fusca TaxID=1439888 RepID=A0A7C9KIC5_9SPHN|nr:type I DNA topoisomerase [Polymorphobacter fuscus]KAB7647905.1 type I DNA topoisomerase [Polymorphobacter fuscus]MQT17221.1 type I DNA topoisomerase [Polymorphobacter fuscus]NJC08785.1 DNA topoisomerase-1 [Polymorphobacter fuscus]
MDLVIVESPAKAKTINKYLGSNYEVLASFGHIRDLPPKDGSVDPDHDFAMLWEVSGDRAKQLKAISDAAKRADHVILATDPDREGEAISWHLLEWLKGKKALPKAGASRVTFNEITKTAILAAMKHPRELDSALIDAYRARRALDYLVGFTLSPVLWRKLPGAKSAGRVQSVALRLICQRESEIEAHRPREYWTIDAAMVSAAGQAFPARLSLWQGKKLDRFDIPDAAAAARAVADVRSGVFTVHAVDTKPATRNPYPPFTTSTLQQEAARKLGFTASHTMRVAQGLYEEGRITYMRTDGVQIAGEAIAAVRDVIAQDYGSGPDVLPDKPRHYATKAKNAQEAHEAIRPTDLGYRPSKAPAGDAEKLYALVWKRTVASQMASAKMERSSIDLLDAGGRTGLRATGQVIITPGFLAVYTETSEDIASDADDDEGRRLPRLTKGESTTTSDVTSKQHFTEPPPRFSEASLVKRLEELGIGRPSTYASILQTLRDRAYVRVEKNRFWAEEKGRLVTAFLERYFEKYVGYDFTADLETRLDDVSAGDLDYLTVLRDFWSDFSPKTKEILELRPSDVTVAIDEYLAPMLFPDKGDGSDPRLCPTCGTGRLSLKTGKFGAFVACSNYPECRYTRQFAGDGGAQENSGPVLLGTDPDSGEPVTLRSGRFGAYVQRGEGEKPPRASIPKDAPVTGPDDFDLALRLLSLPRTIGTHPESGEPITASIGRYGPYLAHNGKYARLTSTAEVFETGMNAAVVKLAEAAAAGPRARGVQAPLREIGAHPVSGAVMKLMAGRFGQYITDGATNATVPKTEDGMTISLDDAAALIDARAAMPSKGKKPVKKAAAKKPAAKKKPPAKKKAES